MQIKKYFFWLAIFCSMANAAPVFNRTAIDTFKPIFPKAGKVVSGSCWTSSIAVNRPSAWRCMVGNAIHDPCFTTVEGGKDMLICDVDPISSKTGFILKLTKPLPEPQIKTTVVNPWILKLADGSFCKPYTGTMPITDKGGIAFYCYRLNGKIKATAKCQIGLLADSIKQGRVWTATRVTFCQDPQSKTGLTAQRIQQIPIKIVWH